MNFAQAFSKCSDEQQRKKLYRKLSMKFHPDRGGSEEKMKELNAAYESAGKDPLYDTLGKRWSSATTGAKSSAFSFDDLNSVFEKMKRQQEEDVFNAFSSAMYGNWSRGYQKANFDRQDKRTRDREAKLKREAARQAEREAERQREQDAKKDTLERERWSQYKNGGIEFYTPQDFSLLMGYIERSHKNFNMTTDLATREGYSLMKALLRSMGYERGLDIFDCFRRI